MNENNLNQQQPPRMPNYPPQYNRRNQRSSNWWIPVVVIGVIVIGFFVIVGIIASQIGGAFEKTEVEVKENSVLYLTLDNGLPEYTKSDMFSFMGGSSSGASFFETIKAINAAKTDERIKGIYIKPPYSSSISMSKAIELMDAIKDFKKSGKFVYAFMEVGDESAYMNVVCADSIFMPTEGIVEMNGFGASSIFLKGFFEKIGINYTVIGFEDFKSAGDMFDKTKFTDSSRYQLEVILNQRFNYFVDAVTTNRKINKDNFISVLNRGVYLADTMKTLGLIDVMATESTVREFMKYKVNGEKYKFPVSIKNKAKEQLIDPKYDKKLRLVTPGEYLPSIKTDKKQVYDEDTQIAIVNGVGAISSGSGISNEYEIKSGDFVKQLKKARDNEKVKAIIIRIDSPGGSVIASDEIWEEIIKTKSVKPVYASMSSVAASGGYYMAMACDTIIAHPATITGSIGVIMAIPNLSGTMDKLGITADTISTGPAAQFLNGMYPYSNENLSQLKNMSQGIYYRFVSRVAESRGKTFEETRALAKGRVWTGEDALKHGLVDVLGGMQTTIDIVKKRLGIPLDKKVMVNVYPEPEDDLQQLLNLFGLGDKENESKINTKEAIAKTLGLTKKDMISNLTMLPTSFIEQVNYMINLAEIANTEKTMYAMPYLFDIK